MIDNPLPVLLALEIIGSDVAYIVMRLEVLKTDFYVYASKT